MSLNKRLGSDRQSVQAIALKARQISHQNAPMLTGSPAYVDVAELLGVLLELGEQEAAKPRPQHTPGPDVGPLGPPEDNAGSSEKVQRWLQAAEARKQTVEVPS